MLLLEQFSKKGISLIASILSFDNISKRGVMPYKFLKVFVWNEQNKKAMHLAKPQLKDTEIEIIGPVQFDFYYNNSNKFKVNKSDWLPLKMIKIKESSYIMAVHQYFLKMRLNIFNILMRLLIVVKLKIQLLF